MGLLWYRLLKKQRRDIFLRDVKLRRPSSNLRSENLEGMVALNETGGFVLSVYDGIDGVALMGVSDCADVFQLERNRAFL